MHVREESCPIDSSEYGPICKILPWIYSQPEKRKRWSLELLQQEKISLIDTTMKTMRL